MATHTPPLTTRTCRAQLLRGIYAILNDDARMLELARAVLDAGVRIVQYRAKSGIVAGNVAALRALTRRYGALLILNDDWQAAEACDCDGVHLGPGDAGFDAIATVRRALPQRLIGLSCATVGEVRAAGDADYLGIGSIFATGSKRDAGAPIGTAALRTLAAATALPVAAVGGITATRVGEVRRSGAAMAAVISAISAATAPQRAARALVDAWDR